MVALINGSIPMPGLLPRPTTRLNMDTVTKHQDSIHTLLLYKILIPQAHLPCMRRAQGGQIITELAMVPIESQ
jgi:hypothetical protein